MIAAGTHATDGNCCRPVRIGPKMDRSVRLRPSATPMGVATMRAMMKPCAALRMLLKVAVQRISCSACLPSAS
ncbi:unannotated protein [freshwater metagenome]|uniref:Unannotated protein n=1 Tax=freshwater metagenome TaxID=449393 RepID=A0A6J7R9E7_9ZZZZ